MLSSAVAKTKGSKIFNQIQKLVRHYNMKERKNIFKMNKEVGILLPNKELIQVE